MRAPQWLHLALRSAPGRPAWATGLRAAVATLVPLLVAQTLGLPGAGTWMSLGGFSCAVADRGGAYRDRATTMAWLAVCASAAAALGGLASSHDVASVVLAFVVVLLASVGQVFGTAAAGVGTSTAVTFVISIAVRSPGFQEAIGRGLWLIAGSLWAMLLSLGLWPLRPYRPIRIAAARCYRAVADYALDLASASRQAVGAAPPSTLQRGRIEVRTALEEARALVAAARRGGPGESRRGERLLVLIQAADQLFGTLIALTDLLDSPESAEDRSQLAPSLEASAADLVRVAARLETET